MSEKTPSSLFQELIVTAQSHSLPFRVLFHEYLERHYGDETGQSQQNMVATQKGCAEQLSSELNKAQRDELTRLFETAGFKLDGRDPEKELRELLCSQEHAYEYLEETKSSPYISSASAEKLQKLQKNCHEADIKLKRLLHATDRSALCFSGGGIRSASFCLGVLQGLARFSMGSLDGQDGNTQKKQGLLQNLDFFSTVSGGGYIGSWWSAWIYRRAKAESGGQQPSSVHFENAHAAVIEALAGESIETAGDPAPQPVRHLREYTSYLAPALGLSLDTWTLIAIVLRNLAVNWLMMLPVLLAAVSLPQVSRFAVHALILKNEPGKHASPSMWWFIPLGILLLVLFAVSAVAANKWLPSHYEKKDHGKGRDGAKVWKVFWVFLFPLFLATWVFLFAWKLWDRLTFWKECGWLGLLAAFSFGVLACGTWLTYRRRIKEVRGKNLTVPLMRRLPVVAGILLLETLIIAAFAAWLVDKIHDWLISLSNLTPPYDWLNKIACEGGFFILLSLPIIWGALLLASSLFSGLIGIYEQEEDREWWARAGGMMLIIIVGWLSAHVVALSAQWAWSGLIGILLGFIGSMVGFSGTTSAGPRPVKVEQLSKIGRFLQKHNLLLPVLCAIALLFITLGVAALEEKLRGLLSGALYLSGFMCSVLILCIASIIALAVNLAVNINIFSLHGMYRMRLMRAFLGASNTQRRPDKFTQFDKSDSPYLHELARTSTVPLHIINTTLNEVGTKNLAWRQRKAQSFTFSPVRCGGWRVGYVQTKKYAGSEGMKLATAMAISGAAFNPNMGYHSSPLVTLLMTLFNVRLGWWLPNPKRADYPEDSRKASFLRAAGPTFALFPLLWEALGKTDDDYRWIELTDGGHFENLALYEMVLRRCKRIIVVDAGADPKCQFEDLGNALRKIEIDLGIPIRFESELKMKKARKENRYCAVATIDYACVDRTAPDAKEEWEASPGMLVYIKASLTGEEPPDIRQYALTHGTFPHETTANQFFNESQFESYRHLGSFIIETLVKQGTTRSKPKYWLLNRRSKSNKALSTDMESFMEIAKGYAQSS